MNERDAFLAAIHAAPDDDAPRLVYSDWLEECGEAERPEFIRIQIEMRREHDAHGRITRRLDALFLKQKDLFRRPWADVLRRCGAATVSTYARGFSTAGFFLPAANFAREAAELAGWFGPATRLALRDCRGNLEPVARCPELRWVHTLTLVRDWRAPDYTDDDLAVLCASPFLDSIRCLNLTGRGGSRTADERADDGLTAAACRSLATARSLTRLEDLDLSDNPIGNAGLTALCASAGLRGLRVLTVQRVGLTARGAEPLSDPAVFPNLQRLDLIGNTLRGHVRSDLEARFGDRVKLNRSRS